ALANGGIGDLTRASAALDVDFLVSHGDINTLLLGDDLFANINLPGLNGLLVHLQPLRTELDAPRLICVSPGLSRCDGRIVIGCTACAPTGTIPPILGQQSGGLLHAASTRHR